MRLSGCSLCIIAKNEEKTLLRCLESVKGIFDEIIIVDTGSTDGTKLTARRYTDKVYDFEWVYDFSAARNYAFSKAEHEYAMWLDADDVIPNEYRGALSKTLSELSGDTGAKAKPDMVYMEYCVGFDEAGRVTLAYDRERIIRLDCGARFQGAIHEAIPPVGTAARSDAKVYHMGKQNRDKNRNIEIFERLLKSKKAFSPRERYYYARELSLHGRTLEAVGCYDQCIRDRDCWVENKISACCEAAQLWLDAKDRAAAKKYLVKSFEFAPPRADACCMMGYIFLEEGSLDAAKFWYELAPSRFGKGGGFVPVDCGGYLPYIQLAVVCDRLGDTALANRYNELAGSIKPDSRPYLHNKAYFESKLKK